MVAPDGPKAVWLTGGYADRYRKEDGAWKFSEVLLDVQTIAPLRGRLGAATVLERLMVPRIDPSELPELARGWGFEPSADEAGELLAVAEAVFSTLDLLDEQEPELPAPVEAVREAGERPSRAGGSAQRDRALLSRARARAARGSSRGSASR